MGFMAASLPAVAATDVSAVYRETPFATDCGDRGPQGISTKLEGRLPGRYEATCCIRCFMETWMAAPSLTKRWRPAWMIHRVANFAAGSRIRFGMYSTIHHQRLRDSCWGAVTL